MGLGGISIAQLAILLVIVLAVFGTKKLRNIGEDLGKAVKNFRDAMNDAEIKPDAENKVLPDNVDKK
jgi:sec-independent protein translocase protein TatA